MKKIFFIAAIISIFNFQFSIASAQQPDAVYKLLRYEWTLNPDGSSDFHYRHEIQILRNRALTAYADKGETFVVYNPDLEELTINEVYTRQLDGTRVEMPQNAFVYQLPSECADCGRFNHIRELAMVHTGMELGCVIVVDYTIHRQYNLLYEDIPLKRDCPVERLEVAVNYSNDIDVKFNIPGNQYLPNGGITRVMSANTDNDDRKLEYTFLNMPQAPRESYMPSDIIPTLHLYNSTPEHTPAFDQAAFKGASDAVMQQAATADNLKTVTAIRNFVVDNIHLNDIHPSHLGYVHSTPEVTWQTGCGTAIDKAVLLAAILNNEGYRARVIGDNMDEVGVFIDTVEYRLDIRHKTPIEVNGEAKDEVKKLTLSEEFANPVFDTLEGGFFALNAIAPLAGEPEVQASRLPLTRTTPLVGSACDLKYEATYTLPKNFKLVGGDINQSISVDGIGCMKVSIKQDGKKLKIVRTLIVEKSVIELSEYKQYRQMLATWQSFEGRALLFRAK